MRARRDFQSGEHWDQSLQQDDNTQPPPPLPTKGSCTDRLNPKISLLELTNLSTTHHHTRYKLMVSQVIHIALGRKLGVLSCLLRPAVAWWFGVRKVVASLPKHLSYFETHLAVRDTAYFVGGKPSYGAIGTPLVKTAHTRIHPYNDDNDHHHHHHHKADV